MTKYVITQEGSMFTHFGAVTKKICSYSSYR